jgi:superfamily II DNA/RNA helicase
MPSNEKSQIAIDFDRSLPDELDFLTNQENKFAEKILLKDIEESKTYLIITGFSSLSYLTKKLVSIKSIPESTIVLGNEPIFRSEHNQYAHKRVQLKDEVRDYWLEEGFSIGLCGAVIQLIELINAGTVKFKILEGLHAKIYVGDNYAILGSSNFSSNGLRNQKEANRRVAKGKKEYDEIKQIAEYYEKQSLDFNTEMLELLKQLLQKVKWQEALARAIAEIIEGDWMKKYPSIIDSINRFKLWPTQKQAIGQALYIFDNFGESVLIADPTGSGKTRLGAALEIAMLNRLWLKGKGSDAKRMIICPPQVIDNWEEEYIDLKADHPKLLSHALLSSTEESTKGKVASQLKSSKLLFIDEAHNFLNRKSNRSTSLEISNADQKVLFTATPINKKVEDLFRLIDIMDVDNMSDEAIKEYVVLHRKKRSLKSGELQSLRSQLNNFTIRRTKNQINAQIDLNPEGFIRHFETEDREVKTFQCRYPAQITKTYKLNESKDDIALVENINKQLEKLQGLLYLKTRINLTNEEKADKERIPQIVDNRIIAAKALARWNVQAMLRSSRAAVIEHLLGTSIAKKEFDLDSFKQTETGNIIGALRKSTSKLPQTNIEEYLPKHLKSLKEFEKAIESEIAIYNRVAELVLKISNNRELSKSRLLLKTANKNGLVLAFDSRIISLHYLKKLILNQNWEPYDLLLITGDAAKEKKLAKRYFGLNSKKKHLIGLCSDSMSEGVNLQRASSIVLLDMPSVMRIAEQRIGRIDRMNSPHEKIFIHWPDDHEAFALKTDERFFKTMTTVEAVLGKNIDLPEELMESKAVEKTLTGKQVVAYYKELKNEKDEKGEEIVDGLRDAFLPVKELVFGKEAIVKKETYNTIKDSKSRVVSAVSFVKSNDNWLFAALKGSENLAPKWVFIESNMVVIQTLPEICDRLRTELKTAIDIEDEFSKSQEILDNFLERFSSVERNILPNKKRRSLLLLEGMLNSELKNKNNSAERSILINKLKNNLFNFSYSEYGIDFYHLAEAWIDIVKPVVANIKTERKNRNKVVHLKSQSVSRAIKNNPIENSQLENLLDSAKLMKSLDRRIASCIIGVAEK